MESGLEGNVKEGKKQFVFLEKNTEETSKYFVERNLEFKTKETTKTLFECFGRKTENKKF